MPNKDLYLFLLIILLISRLVYLNSIRKAGRIFSLLN
jgi:hypothetical protein